MPGRYLYFIFFFSLLFHTALPLKAQEVLLEMDTHNSVVTKTKGINHKSFGALFFNYQVYPFHSSSDLDVIAGKSRNFAIGYQRLFRLNHMDLISGRIAFFNDGFFVSQKNGKTFPSLQMHQSEKLLTYNLSAEIGNRVILKKEYEKPGLYVEFGFVGNLTLGSRLFMNDSSSDPLLQGKSQETKIKGLKYVEPFTGGIILKLGLNHFALVVQNRLTSWLKPSYGFAQPPKTSFGLEFNLY